MDSAVSLSRSLSLFRTAPPARARARKSRWHDFLARASAKAAARQVPFLWKSQSTFSALVWRLCRYTRVCVCVLSFLLVIERREPAAGKERLFGSDRWWVHASFMSRSGCRCGCLLLRCIYVCWALLSVACFCIIQVSECICNVKVICVASDDCRG